MAMPAQAKTAGELWDEFGALAERLSPRDWERPTPCARWTVKDLLAHCTGLQTAMDGSAPQPAAPEGWSAEAEGLSGLDAWTELGVVARRGWTREQLLDELRVARAGHVARFEQGEPDEEAMGPFGATTLERLHGFRCFDLWVHLQDLHLALDRDVDLGALAPGAVDACAHVFRGLPALAVKRVGLSDGDRLGVLVRPPVPVRGTVEIVEGRGALVPGEPDPEHTVEAQPGALALLLAGRGTPERWRDAGALEWRGALGEAFVRRARVFGA